MEIRFKQHFADPGKRTYQEGEVVDLDEVQAIKMLNYGFAEAVEDQQKKSKREVPEQRETEKRKKKETR